MVVSLNRLHLMMVLRRRGVHTQLRVNLKPTEDCEMCQELYRDDGAPLGCVLRLEGASSTYAYTTTGVPRRLGACPTDEAARRAVGPRRVRCGEC